MALISLRNVSVAFGGPPLLDGIDLQLEAGDRLCLMGRNGTGKSTLLQLVSGEIGPDLLLLDEPTNHPDIKSIAWPEGFLLKQVRTLLFVTHDRAFARRISNRVAELDRGRLFAFDCGYDAFVGRREELLAGGAIPPLGATGEPPVIGGVSERGFSICTVPNAPRQAVIYGGQRRPRNVIASEAKQFDDTEMSGIRRIAASPGAPQ